MTKLEEPKARTSMADGSKPAMTRTLAPAQPKGRLWPWLLAALLLCAAAGVGYWFFKGRVGQSAATTQQANGAGRPTPVVAATARQGDVNLYLVGLGAVDPFYTVSVHTRVDGEIMKVAFQEGQLVKKGDPLIEIDPRPYQAALLQAQGQLDKDQAQLINARLNVQRDTDAGTAISAQQLSTDTATEQQTEGAIKVDQAAIDSAQLNVTYSHIASPIDGRIGLRLVDVGNIVHSTDTNAMAVITQLQPIAVLFNLPEDDIPRIVKSMKQNPKLPVQAYDRDSKTLLASGTLLTIDNEVNPASGTFACKAQFDNKDGNLFPSQFVNARLLVDTLHNAVIVPAAGVQQGPDSTFVYVVQPDNTVALRTVTVTQLSGNEILVAAGIPAGSGEQACIESGLSPGEVIVTDGVDKLIQGAKVQVSRAGAGGRGGATTASASGWSHGANGAPADESGNTDASGAAAGAGGGGWHHRRAASGPVDQDGNQSAAGDANSDAGQAGAGTGTAGGVWHHHRSTSGPADQSTGPNGDGQ
jgi:membrane fusion protein, multidrug efflux system